MSQAAEVIAFQAPNGYGRAPDEHNRIQGSGRAIAVAKFRELANMLESGELDCARVQWSDTHGCLLEHDGTQYDLTKDGVVAPKCAQPISGMEIVTRTAWREDGSGTVAFVSTTIEEI
jgi:hypothetical protein